METKRVCRILPRRRKQGSEEPAAFIQKSFDMISSCDPNIASWAKDGASFFVKSKDFFSRDVIPQFFKHNKYASFVRQLNFYGFRKVHQVPATSSETLQINMDWDEFQHPFFQRGRDDLLVQVKRGVHYDHPGQAEPTFVPGDNRDGESDSVSSAGVGVSSDISALHGEVKVLKSMISTLQTRLETMEGVILSEVQALCAQMGGLSTGGGFAPRRLSRSGSSGRLTMTGQAAAASGGLQGVPTLSNNIKQEKQPETGGVPPLPDHELALLSNYNSMDGGLLDFDIGDLRSVDFKALAEAAVAQAEVNAAAAASSGVGGGGLLGLKRGRSSRGGSELNLTDLPAKAPALGQGQQQASSGLSVAGLGSQLFSSAMSL